MRTSAIRPAASLGGLGRALGWVALGLAVLAIIIFWGWRQGAQSRAVHQLAAPTRHELYLRTLENLQSPACNGGPGGLQSFCRGQAELILEFPECDAVCRAAAAPFRRTGGAR